MKEQFLLSREHQGTYAGSVIAERGGSGNVRADIHSFCHFLSKQDLPLGAGCME